MLHPCATDLRRRCWGEDVRVTNRVSGMAKGSWVRRATSRKPQQQEQQQLHEDDEEGTGSGVMVASGSVERTIGLRVYEMARIG